MQPFMLISALVATYMCKVDGQQSCPLPGSTGQGSCIEIFNCPELASLLSQPNRSQQEVDLLKKAHCGFSGRTPLVCCACRTPEGQSGQCINIYSCPSIVNRLKPPVSQAAVQYVQKSRCNGPDNMSVCCGNTAVTSEPSTAEPIQEPGVCNLRATPPTPSSGCCGVESSTVDRIFGGNATNVDEYPWLVAIEYQKNDKIKILCGGTLISGRYVLTAGHCVSGPILNAGRPINVRLGDYDITNNGPDCTVTSGGGTDCTDGAIIVPIESTIPHPGYNANSNMKRHDIALIKLTSTAPFTDFIRPICLPVTDVTQSLPSGAKLWVAGWGAVDDRHSAAKKQHVDLPYLDANECQPSYTAPGRNVPLWRGQLCAGGEKNKDSCKGDSGGPLMYISPPQEPQPTQIVGVVSFGPTPCGLEDIPGVYTKVFEYDNWIRRNMLE